MQLKRQRQFSLKVVLRRSSRETRFFPHQSDITWLHALKWLTVHVARATAACGQLENCCISQLMTFPSHHAAAVYVSGTDGCVLYCSQLKVKFKSHSVSKGSQRSHKHFLFLSQSCAWWWDKRLELKAYVGFESSDFFFSLSMTK